MNVIVNTGVKSHLLQVLEYSDQVSLLEKYSSNQLNLRDNII